MTTAQQAHVTALPEQDSTQVAAWIEHMRSETERLRPHLRSVEAGRGLQSVATSVATLSDIEARAQEHVRLGQALMAADLVSSDGRSAGAAIASGFRNLRAAENEAYAAARAGALDSLWTSVGGVAVLWVVGLIVLARQPSLVIREESSPVTLWTYSPGAGGFASGVSACAAPRSASGRGRLHVDRPVDER